MKELALITIPLLGALGAIVWRREDNRRWFFLVAVPHALLAVWMLVSGDAGDSVLPPGWLKFDAVSRAVLPAFSLLFLACSIYGISYLKIRSERPNRVFVSAFLALGGLISLSLQAQHLGLLWISAEAATLATVPLLHFNGTARAYEATWKYLLVGGTGIALSLLGAFFLGYASLGSGASGDLTFAGLAASGPGLSRPWVLSAWVLLLAGFGTKMGLAPMHTWKPDAYGEAPGIIGAMLAGGMTTVAFVALLRVRTVVDAAGLGSVANTMLIVLGLFSMIIAALFLLGTPDFKRMLAYSSVEHMGILSVGAALGGAGLLAALFHVWSNTLTKGALFLSAGNLRRAANARTVGEVSGMTWVTPVSARVFVTGLFAVTACPPFSPFFSELGIVRASVGLGSHWVTAVFLACLLLAFLGMSRLVFAIVDGRPKKAARPAMKLRERAGTLIAPLALLGASLLLGLFTPSLLRDVWAAAVTLLGGAL